MKADFKKENIEKGYWEDQMNEDLRLWVKSMLKKKKSVCWFL